MVLDLLSNIETFNTFLLCKEVMPNPGYRSLNIPESLYKRLKQYMENSNGRYVSVSEVVREAVWSLLKKK